MDDRAEKKPDLRSGWETWVKRPRQIWLRRALFQIHLWLGVGLGLYVLAIGVSGSVLVFRNELYNAFTAPPLIVEQSGIRLTPEAVRSAAIVAYPDHEVSRVWENERNPDQAVEIVLDRDGREIQRLFDPYTGRDLGDVVPAGIRVVSWLQDLHINLLGGETGRLINGAGAVLWLVIGITGVFVWWPGIGGWWRSLWVRWKKASWVRFNWDLHSATGIWTLLFVLLWGVTGIHLAIPGPFWQVVDYLEPAPTAFSPVLRVGEQVLRWSARLHFGNFAGKPVQVLWLLIGLAPVVLAVTGVVMWWNRVLRKRSDRG